MQRAHHRIDANFAQVPSPWPLAVGLLAAALIGNCAVCRTADAQSSMSIKFAADAPDASATYPDLFPPDGDGGVSSIEGPAGIYGSTGWFNSHFGMTTGLVVGGHPEGIIFQGANGGGGDWSPVGSLVSGDDGDLMCGYTLASYSAEEFYEFRRLNPLLAYNVVIYHQGELYDPQFPRVGGTFTLTSPTLPEPISVSYVDDGNPFEGTFVAEQDYHVIPIFGVERFRLTVSNMAGGTYLFETPINGLEVVPVPPPVDADFDDDDVDGDDFLTWQRGLGLTDVEATHPAGNADGDGDIDDADFAVWTSQFGTSPSTGGASPVPEPAILLLVIVAAAGIRGLGRQMRQELVSP